LDESKPKRRQRSSSFIDSQPEPEHRSETLAEFAGRCEEAKILGEESIETTIEVINRLIPGGLKGASHVMYRGILVCPEGTTDEVYKNMNLSHEEKTFKTPSGINSVDRNA